MKRGDLRRYKYYMGIKHSQAMARDRREWRKIIMEVKSHSLL
jgi:hypothetical protein